MDAIKAPRKKVNARMVRAVLNESRLQHITNSSYTATCLLSDKPLK